MKMDFLPRTKMFIRGTFLLSLIASSGLYAQGPWSPKILGGMDSGGGRGYVCFNDLTVAQKVRKNQGLIADDDLSAIVSIEPLDLFEARRKRGVEPRTPVLAEPQRGEGHLEYLERLLERIEISFPTLGGKIRESEGELYFDNLIWQEMALIPIMDENTAGSYNGSMCAVTTMAIQFREESHNYLTIDHRLFYHPNHSTMGRAVLLLHEYMYLVARKSGRADSRSTRIAIGLLLRNEENINLVELEKELVSLHFISPEESLGERPERPTFFPPLSDY